MSSICWLAFGAAVGIVLTGCGLSRARQSACATPPQTLSLEPAPAWLADRVGRAAPDVYFDLNSHTLQPREHRKLAQSAEILRGILQHCSELIIVIEGHCDDRGATGYNERLGMERADTVRRVLLDLGFAERQLRTVSVANRAPRCTTQDELCRQKNRRVHFRAAQAVPGRRL
jgi:outer membrane protein OmpA-like peptidoglycan-associated protein